MMGVPICSPVPSPLTSSAYLPGHVLEKLPHPFQGTAQLRAGRMVSPAPNLDKLSTELLEPRLDRLQACGHGFWAAQVAPALE